MKLPRSRGSQLYFLHLIGMTVGFAIVVSGFWRSGIIVVGMTFVAAAIARSVVPPEHTGMLRVRGKIFDIVWMSILGVSLVVLALVVPPQPGG